MAARSLQDVIEQHQAGQLDEAEVGYRALLEENADNADAIHLLGVICFQRCDLEQACDLVRRAIDLNDSDPLYYSNLGRIEKANGDTLAAIEAYRHSLSINTNQVDVNSDLAAALIDIGEFEEALKYAEKSLGLAPGHAPAALNLGLALNGVGNIDGALDALNTAIRLDNGLVEAWFQIAQLYQEKTQPAEAELSYNNVLAIDPNHVEALCNLGNLLRLKGDLDHALSLYDKALTLAPDRGEILSNKGVTLHEQGRRDEAIACFRRAIELEPDDAETHRNLSMALLQGEGFEEGWAEFEWRWKTKHFAHIRRDWNVPQWSGGALERKTILVHAEQGFGDSFQFCRYIPLLAQRGGRVIVEAPDIIQEVIGTVGGIEAVIAPGDDLPEIDYHVPMMSLPFGFRASEDNLLVPNSYLSAPFDALKKWQKKLEHLHGRRIGIVWKGNSEHARNLWRSPGLDVLRPLFDEDNCSFTSLQKDDGLKDLNAANLTGQVLNLEDELQTFSDTAAVIANLDLVITPDTSVAHLSAALGKPTWVMLPFVAEWRWGIGRDVSPWYPSIRLFRQKSAGDWAGVVAEMGEQLLQ
jgi:tetratricopeptide (TPR) repeat protein